MIPFPFTKVVRPTKYDKAFKKAWASHAKKNSYNNLPSPFPQLPFICLKVVRPTKYGKAFMKAWASHAKKDSQDGTDDQGRAMMVRLLSGCWHALFACCNWS